MVSVLNRGGGALNTKRLLEEYVLIFVEDMELCNFCLVVENIFNNYNLGRNVH